MLPFRSRNKNDTGDAFRPVSLERPPLLCLISRPAPKNYPDPVIHNDSRVIGRSRTEEGWLVWRRCVACQAVYAEHVRRL